MNRSNEISLRPVLPAIDALKGQNDNSTSRNSVTNDVNERIQWFNHAPIDESMPPVSRNVDLSNRKRACALMTGHVIDEFVSVSLNAYLVIQSRVTCANLCWG